MVTRWVMAPTHVNEKHRLVALHERHVGGVPHARLRPILQLPLVEALVREGRDEGMHAVLRAQQGAGHLGSRC